MNRKTGALSPCRRTVLSLFAACLTLSAATVIGCNDRGTETYPIWQPDQAPPARIYSTSPESTSELLRDASQAVRAMTSANQGVRFTVLSTGAINNPAASSRGEGYMVLPDKVRMTTWDYLSREPVSTDVIVIGTQTYIRSEATGGVWKTGDSPSMPPEPGLITGYLDYARGSRNFGQETLSDGRKTYHVQVDVDMPLLAADLIKNTADPAQLKKLEAMKTAVLTVDFWIDTDSRLINRMLVNSANQPQSQAIVQDFIFSSWGESMEISRPCEAC